MKTMKHTGKKVLSVFLAVLMLMTCWVWVAPEKAEAVTLNSSVAADVSPAPTYATYHVSVRVTFQNVGSGGNIQILYYPVMADGNLDTQHPGTYKLVNSAKQYSTKTWTFNTADDTTRALGDYWTATTGRDYGAEHGPVQGWPYAVEFEGISSATIRCHAMTIGNNITVFDAGTDYYSSSGGNVKTLRYTDDLDNKNWNVPTATTISGLSDTVGNHIIPKIGTNANIYFTQRAVFTDQYGVTMPVTPTYKILNESFQEVNEPSSIEYRDSKVYVYEGAQKLQPDKLTSKYYLEASYGGKSQRAAITLTHPTYTVKFYNANDGLIQTVDKVYGAKATPPAAPQKAFDSNYHYTFTSWNPTSYDFVTGNTDIYPTYTSQSHTYETNYSYVDNTYHQTKCSVCGHTKNVDHAWNLGVQTKAPSCEAKGVKTYTCTAQGCGATYTEDIPATGHEFTGAWAMKSDGQNGEHYRKCKNCETYGLDGVKDKGQAHSWDDGKITTPSACEGKGVKTFTCTVEGCGATYTQEVAATGHNNVVHTEAQAKSCGVYGWSEYWTCTDCGKVWIDEALTQNISNADDNGNGTPDAVEIEADAHKFDGTCVSVTTGKDGTHYYECSLCGKAYGVDGVENATKPHNWGDPTVVESTCTKEGSKTYKCDNCPETYTETIGKASHTMTKIDGKPAACEVPGNNEYYFCSACNKYYKDAEGTTETTVEAEIIKALEHTWSEHHDYDTLKTAATCQSPAIYNNHCDYCEVSLFGQTHLYGSVDTENGHNFNDFEDIQKNADKTHSYGCSVEGCNEYGPGTKCEYKVTADVASTCKTYGYTTYECTVCGNGYSDNKGLDPNKHEGGTKVIGKLDAKCNSNGYTGDTHCIGCDAKLETGSIITADPTIHPHENMKDYDGVDSTCQTPGYKAYKYCDQCGTYEIEKETIGVKDHTFTTYTSNENGTHTAICDTCDETAGEVAKDTKTCTGGKANCVDKAVCEVCNEAYGEVDGTNHKTPKLVAKVDSTCQTEGHEAYYTCEACDKDMEEIKTIAKKDHVYGAWTSNGDDTHTRTCTTCDEAVAVKATETEICSGGKANCVEQAVCTVCKAAYGEVNENNHKIEAATLKNQKDATCTAPGYTGDRHYDCCDAIKDQGSEIPQLDHKYTVEVENSRVAATCIEKGSVTYKCETCEDTKVQELNIDPLNHASEETITVGAVTATCTTEGYTGDIYHACCYKEDASASDNRKALISKGTVIKVSGVHTFGAAYPEYMIELTTETDENDVEVITGFIVKEEEPTYEEKIAARHDDDKWYHVQQCAECKEVVFEACYTYAHTYNCVDTDICEVCEGLCSLTAPLKHKGELTFVEAVEATCEKEGTKAHYECEYCGKKFFDEAGQKEITKDSDLNIPTSGKHEINPDVPAVPNPDKPGTHKLECIDCDEPVIVDCSGGTATCKDKAVCDVCNTAYGELDPANHAGEDTILIGYLKETCSEDGYTGDVYYACCYSSEEDADNTAALKSKGEVILADATQHVIVIKDNGDGTHTESCSACDTELATENHEWVAGEIPETASCTEGYDLTYTCRCGATKTENVPATGHDYGSFVTTKEATCTEKGEKAKTCKFCGDTVTEEIATKGHDMRTIAGIKPTCSTEGSSDYIYCNRCGLIVQESTKLPATGCEDENHDGFCDDCGDYLKENADGTKCNCICHKQNVFMKFIYKILRFFWKLFGISRTCCSAGTHY